MFEEFQLELIFLGNPSFTLSLKLGSFELELLLQWHVSEQFVSLQ